LKIISPINFKTHTRINCSRNQFFESAVGFTMCHYIIPRKHIYKTVMRLTADSDKAIFRWQLIGQWSISRVINWCIGHLSERLHKCCATVF